MTFPQSPQPTGASPLPVSEKPKRLGRGLEALISGTPVPLAPTTSQSGAAVDLPFRELPLAAIAPNPFQPRRSFKPEELAELENSMRVAGLLQPIAVRPRGDDRFELVAGERRLRAAARLGWTSIPAVIRSLDDREMLVLALVENLQRADLNPIDEALGLQRLIEEFSYTQQQVADALGKDRSTIANLLRVLALPEGIRRMVREQQISLGHARALLAMPDERAMLDAAHQIVERQLSVREVERMSQHQRSAAPGARTTTRRAAPETPERTPQAAEVRRLTELLRRRLQTDVRIDLQADARGSVAMAFYSVDDLHRLIELILGRSLEDA